MPICNVGYRTRFWRNPAAKFGQALSDARIRRRLYRPIGVFLALTLLLGGHAGGASAAQHQNANSYADWNLGGHADLWMIDQQIAVSRLGHHSFLALLWTYTGAHEGGYLGYQTDAARP